VCDSVSNVAQIGLELLSLLSWLSKCWDYRHVQPIPGLLLLFLLLYYSYSVLNKSGDVAINQKLKNKRILFGVREMHFGKTDQSSE
jgi:hypothetical protein